MSIKKHTMHSDSTFNEVNHFLNTDSNMRENKSDFYRCTPKDYDLNHELNHKYEGFRNKDFKKSDRKNVYFYKYTYSYKSKFDRERVFFGDTHLNNDYFFEARAKLDYLEEKTSFSFNNMKYTEYKNDYYNDCGFIKTLIDEKLVNDEDLKVFDTKNIIDSGIFKYDRKDEIDYLKTFNGYNGKSESQNKQVKNDSEKEIDNEKELEKDNKDNNDTTSAKVDTQTQDNNPNSKNISLKEDPFANIGFRGSKNDFDKVKSDLESAYTEVKEKSNKRIKRNDKKSYKKPITSKKKGKVGFDQFIEEEEEIDDNGFDKFYPKDVEKWDQNHDYNQEIFDKIKNQLDVTELKSDLSNINPEQKIDKAQNKSYSINNNGKISTSNSTFKNYLNRIAESSKFTNDRDINRLAKVDNISHIKNQVKHQISEEPDDLKRKRNESDPIPCIDDELDLNIESKDIFCTKPLNYNPLNSINEEIDLESIESLEEYREIMNLEDGVEEADVQEAVNIVNGEVQEISKENLYIQNIEKLTKYPGVKYYRINNYYRVYWRSFERKLEVNQLFPKHLVKKTAIKCYRSLLIMELHYAHYFLTENPKYQYKDIIKLHNSYIKCLIDGRYVDIKSQIGY